MVTLDDITQMVGDVLQIGSQVESFSADTPLLGSVPEFDSMAVVSVITAIEEQYGVMIDDDEVSAEIFETMGSLQDFIEKKVAA